MARAGALRLTLGCGDYDINRGLIDGDVQPEGIDLVSIVLSSPERHWRMMRGLEFDICELSLGSYLTIADQKSLPFIGIPAFPHRRFRHSYFFVRSDAGINVPKDLEGRRVGIRTWQNSALIWMRGMIEEDYGVDLTTIDWYRQDEEDMPVDIPEVFKVIQLRRDQNLNQMLLDGEVDALLYPEIPTAFKQGDPRIRRLFPDPKQEEMEWYKRTGYFPTMHTVVIKESVLEQHPWVATSMLKAFRASKDLAFKKMEDPRRISLAWVTELIEEQREVMGPDPWSYDLPSNRKALEAMIRYAHRQGLIKREMPVEELFFPPSLETMPIGYV